MAERKDISTGAVYGSEEFSAKQEELKSAEQGKETLCKDIVAREKDLFSGCLFNFNLTILASLCFPALKGYPGLAFHTFRFNETWLCSLETFGALWL